MTNVASTATNRARASISRVNSIVVMVFSSFSLALIGLTWTGLKAGVRAQRERPRSAEDAGRSCTNTSAEANSLGRCARPATTITVSAQGADRRKT